MSSPSTPNLKRLRDDDGDARPKRVSRVVQSRRNPETEAALKKLILDELDKNDTRPQWLRAQTKQGFDPISIERSDFSLTAELRQETQGQGKTLGCHTCPARLEIDPDQPWTADHTPPTRLRLELKRVVMASVAHWDGHTYLFPQCDRCRIEQGPLVEALNSGQKTFNALSLREKRLFGHGIKIKPNVNCIRSYSDVVPPPAGRRIQEFGIENGCHSCGSDFPASVYIADHIFPQEFCTHYMQMVFELLGIEYPTEFELRPQCPRCSGDQGGSIRYIAERVQDYARLIGIPVYKT